MACGIISAMSRDERERSVRRPRAVARPQVPAGPLRDLKDLLYEMYLQAGMPTLDEIAGEIGKLHELDGAPERDTIRRCLGTPELPANQHDAVAVATVLARAARWDQHDAVARVRTLWVEAKMAPHLGQPIGELADPLALEVHRAIDVGAGQADLPVLPLYVERAHDVRLQKIVKRAAAGQRVMAVLVGGSSTGKTRACWEAVQVLKPEWRLWHPIDPGRPEAVIEELVRLGPKTVLWLNEIQHYLLTPGREIGEQVASSLRELLRDPGRASVLVLGTVWPEYWAALTIAPSVGQPDPHSQARELLTGTDIPVPDSFAGTAVDDLRAAAERDPRWAKAVTQAEHGRFTQFLAGVPVLLERYRNAPPGARALIEAAMDARRLGHGLALPHGLLEVAAPGYLTDSQWDSLSEDWLEQSLAYTAVPCHGIRGPLSRIRPRIGEPTHAHPSYRLADFLEQQGRATRHAQPVPAALWDAFVSFAPNEHLPSLARQARDRGLYRHAAAMANRAAQHGAAWAMHDLADAARRLGDRDCATAWLRCAAETGDEYAMTRLAETLLAHDPREAEKWLKAAVKAGSEYAFDDLIKLLDRADRQPEAEQLLRSSMARGDDKALARMVGRLKRAGHREQAEALLREAAVNGSPRARSALACALVRVGRIDEAETFLPVSAYDGYDMDLFDLTKELFGTGRHVDAEAWLHRLIDDGDISAKYILIRSLDEHDRRGEAEEWLRSIAESGRPDAMSELADRLDAEGRADEAEVWHRRSAEAEHERRDQSLYWLSMRLDAQGRQDEAAHYRRQAIDALNDSHSLALTRFPHWLAERFGAREAERVLQDLADVGNWTAAVFLAGRLEEYGRYEESERALRPAVEAGDSFAMTALGRLLLKHSDRHDEAESWLRRAAQTSRRSDSALGLLGQLLVNDGRGDEANRLKRFGIEPDGTTAAPWPVDFPPRSCA
jgi:tetratricopeptide (TPR) repeat protein